MLELARHAELHAAGVIEYFDNFDEHSEGAMFGRTIRRLVCSDNKVVELSRSKKGKEKGGQRAVGQRDKVRVAAVADDQRAVARRVGPAGGE